jgi:GTP-binding protein
MIEYLAGIGRPTVVVLTKMDKLKTSERKDRVARTLVRLAVDPEQVIPFSAKTGEGRDTLLDSLDALLGEDTP